MNFFARQEAARRKTRVLLCYYVAAVIAIVGALYFASRYLAVCCGQYMDLRHSAELVEAEGPAFRIFAWHRLWFLWTAGLTLTVIAGGTLWRFATLQEGGAPVARSAGGRELSPGAESFHERRLMNIVEEMALASGLPVPRVFVLERERGVNAFAAGFSPRDAAIAVTRTAMEQLTRDELQGVVAHEFSHILNGDMRLNSWLIGVLYGMLVLSIGGRILMQVFSRFSFWPDEDDSRRGGPAALSLFALGGGLVLWAVGSVGVLFARLIQRSVCRQREYLADASAVQFTRNPMGLANALKRIGASPFRNTLQCANRDELTHLLFASGAGLRLDDLFASHPPMLRRIRLLDPAFDGQFAPWRLRALSFEDVRNTPERVSLREAGLLLELAGAELTQASAFLQALPAELRRAVAHPVDAAGVLYGLLLSDDESVRQRQKGRILAVDGQPLAVAAERWQTLFQDKDRTYRRMLSELAIEGLRQRDPVPRATVVRFVRELVDADGEVSLFEYMLERRLIRRLDNMDGRVTTGMRALPAAHAQLEAALVLGTLAYAGQPADDGRAQAAWHAGSGRMSMFGLGELVPVRESCTLEAFDRALAKLRELSPLDKGELLAGCAAVIAADGCLSPDETELLRSVADMLDTPLPSVAA